MILKLDFKTLRRYDYQIMCGPSDLNLTASDDSFKCGFKKCARFYTVPDHFLIRCKVFLLPCVYTVPDHFLSDTKVFLFPRVYTVPGHFWSDTKVFLCLAFTLYLYSFGAVQVQNCASFLAGAKLCLFPSRYKTVPDSRYKVVPDHFI